MSIFNNINSNDPFGALQVEGVGNPGFPSGFQNSPFQNESEETEPEFHTKGIDFNSLVKKLKNSNSFNFKYSEFLNPDTIITPTNPIDGTEPIETRFHIQPIVTSEEGQRTLKLTGGLNKKEGVIRKSSRKSVFSFELKVNDTIKYIKKIKYANSDENAIEIISASYNDYRDLSEAIGVGNNTEVKTKIKNKFNTAFRNVGDDLRDLKWLYENAPTFALNQRGDNILIQDLKKLLTYDTEGTFSWFKDSSSAIINLLLGFKDLKKVYDHFYNNPEEVIRLYSALEGEKKENFIFLLTSLSHIFWKEASADVTFMIGPNFKLDSNILIKKNQKEINLQGYSVEKKTQEIFLGEYGVIEETTTNSQKIEQPKTNFHPLELVALQDEASGKREVVCALQVKSLSDKAEWKQVVTVIEIVVVVIAIIASAGVLAAPGAAVAVTVIAAVELVVSVADLVHIFKRANLDGTEEEDWFVKNWPEISFATGVVSISTVLRRGLLKHGPKVLGKLKAIRNATSVAIQKKIITLITEIQVELYFFFKQGVVLVSFEPFSVLARSVYSKFAKKMEAYGVLLTKPVEGSKIRALMYNGQKIAEGTDKELKVVLKEIFPFGKNGKVLDNLNGIVAASKHLDGYRIPYKKVSEYARLVKGSITEIVRKFGYHGKKLFDDVENEFKTFASKHGLTSNNQLREYQLLSGMSHSDFPNLTVLKTNFPKKELDDFLTKVLRKERFQNLNFDDINKIYNHFGEEIHELIKKRIINHLKKLDGELTYDPDVLSKTGGLPGTHAEVRAVNELLFKLEAKGIKVTDHTISKILGYNKMFRPIMVQPRCADCFYILNDVKMISLN